MARDGDPLAPQIWIGDALRVCNRLEVDVADVPRVLRLLGLVEPALGGEPAGAAAVAAVSAPTLLGAASAGRAAGGGRRERLPTARDVAESRRREGPEPLTVPPPPGVPPVPTVDVVRADRRPPRRLPSLAEVLVPPADMVLEPADLLDPARQRAVLTPLCSGPAATGRPDVDAIVERLANGLPLQTLPREVAVTTRRGVQVLIDHGAAMIPFWRDQQDLISTLRLVAGPDGFEVLHFSVTPRDAPGAGKGPQWTWAPYRPPISAIPVLVLSDLATGARASERPAVVGRWLAFAATVHGAGCPLVALVPAPLERVPSVLRRAISVVPWDRPTGVRDAVVAARRAAGRVPGRPG